MVKKIVPDNVKKRNAITTYLNDQQTIDLDKKALESNLSVSNYVRILIISQQ